MLLHVCDYVQFGLYLVAPIDFSPSVTFSPFLLSFSFFFVYLLRILILELG